MTAAFLTASSGLMGGATTSNSLVQGYTGAGGTIAVPSVDDQVATFLGKTTPQGQAFTDLDSAALSSPLFVFFAGPNDILFNPNISASQTYQALLQAGTQLQTTYGTAKFLTISPPDLSKLPYGFYVDALAKENLQSFTNLLGDLLRRPRFAAVNVDLRQLFEEFEYYAAPQTYGFHPLEKYGSCLEGAYEETSSVTVCQDATSMVYWDEYHPTTQTHSWIAKQVLSVLDGPF
ncbi:putative GDSL-like Lipase/Acylhydrolase [Colletotrichum sublineola]|uniref:Putative GDSL-like Lipase/Acylhydrolase n=1 Tax=Colletotrichum sublineola TaxID=1173701 RepID=A0A066XSS0_COLSU|nr:putative GDSL-like Lipase/Acylhydrolase [Colletotrichum sublineola]